MLASGELGEALPELAACVGVPQNPAYHPEGDVFEHTMLVLDCAAGLRDQAKQPLAFMLAALLHDLGKAVATQVQPDGKITAYGHERAGLELCERQLRRLTGQVRLIEYVKNMMWLHMRPNILAQAKSSKKKTRQLFDLSVCPEDLILLSRADASGKRDRPYDAVNEAFLRERLEDYYRVLKRPMVTGKDLIDAGLKPGPMFSEWLRRARMLHFSGIERDRALRQVVGEAKRDMGSI
jgi:tRNA nucleotidyltransferase (CCA-adding enzyme)